MTCSSPLETPQHARLGEEEDGTAEADDGQERRGQQQRLEEMCGARSRTLLVE